MAQHPDVDPVLVEGVLASSPMLERFYLSGGGSPSDLRTDLSHGLARLATLRGVYLGPDRRQIDLAALPGQRVGGRRRTDAASG